MSRVWNSALALLLVFQLAGEAISLYFALPVPGPVLGMVILNKLALKHHNAAEAP